MHVSPSLPNTHTQLGVHAVTGSKLFIVPCRSSIPRRTTLPTQAASDATSRAVSRIRSRAEHGGLFYQVSEKHERVIPLVAGLTPPSLLD